MADPAARHWPALALDPRRATDLPEDFSDRLAVALDEVAATSVDPQEGVGWRVYFADEASRDRACGQLKSSLGSLVEVTPVDVADEGWVVKAQAGLGPVRVGRFVVTPPWHAPPGPPGPATEPGTTAIVIEPSMGFGTGHHQSTRLCLAALQRLPLANASVVDVGTGSGVLAIAAAMLGARDVVAIDDDADAVAAASANVGVNRVGDRVRVEVADVSRFAQAGGDVVLANLTALLLHRHARALSNLVAPGGHLVTSGFTIDQVQYVSDAFPEFIVEARDEEDDWVGLTLRRR